MSGGLIVALDFDRLDLAYDLAHRLSGLADMFKIGSQLFSAEGPAAVRKIARLGAGIFLDLKFHDIPSSVSGAVSAAADLPGVCLINVHALGGLEMMRAAAQSLGRAHKRSGGRPKPKLLAVTVLTSLDRAAMLQVGIASQPQARAVKLARLARKAGLDGVVTSAHETSAIRRACGREFLIVVPGVRPGAATKTAKSSENGNDQARVATPAEAIRGGADYIVVGRPITSAPDPRTAAAAILNEIAEIQRPELTR